MPDFGERSPSDARLIAQLRARLIDDGDLSTVAKIRDATNHHFRKAISLQRKEGNPKDKHLVYAQLVHLTRGALLSFDRGGPHSQRVRAICAQRYDWVKPDTPLLALVLKAFGGYDNSSPEARRRSNKKVSRDYNALSFVLSRGIAPGTKFLEYLEEHGLDACSRHLKMS
jgi:hypothetical protein